MLPEGIVEIIKTNNGSIIQEEKLQISINSCISLKPFIYLIV